MWVPKAVVDWFQISKDSVDALREELAATKAELASTRHHLEFTKSGFEWVRVRVNQLELERNGLMERAYNIKLPVPEIVRTPKLDLDAQNFSFEDLGNDIAKHLGYPAHTGPYTTENN